MKQVLQFAIIALVNFIDIRDKLDTLAYDEEDHNDDEDSGHAGLLNTDKVGIFQVLTWLKPFLRPPHFWAGIWKIFGF